MSEQTDATPTETPVVNGAAVTAAEPAKADPKSPAAAEQKPKPPPSTKDWEAVTKAEKVSRSREERVAARAKELDARAAALDEREKSAGAGLDALRKAYNDGDYSRLEVEFPDLYRRLTQSKLKGGKPPPKPEVPVTKESLLAELRAEQKAEAEKTATVAREEYRVKLENNLVTAVRGAAEKFPQLAIEIEDSPELVRQWLHGMDNASILRSDGKPFSSLEEAAGEMEARFKARLERRQKALGQVGVTPTTKTPSESGPGDTAGASSGSGGPTTLSSRLSQESALPTSPASAAATQGDDPVSRLRRKQDADQRDLERATAEFVALRNRT